MSITFQAHPVQTRQPSSSREDMTLRRFLFGVGWHLAKLPRFCALTVRFIGLYVYCRICLKQSPRGAAALAWQLIY